MQNKYIYALCLWFMFTDVYFCRMFMYIFLGGLVVLMLFGMYQALETRTVGVLISLMQRKRFHGVKTAVLELE